MDRDRQNARAAYQAQDTESSRLIHNNKSHQGSDDSHATESFVGKYIKAIVFGGIDGLITTFAIVTSICGADLEPHVALVVGLSLLLAGGLSMGVGEAQSKQAEIDLRTEEQQRETWELQNFKAAEVQEMIEIYLRKGVSLQDSNTILNTMVKYPQLFVDHMLVEELGIMPVRDVDPHEAWLSGLATFLAFLVFGLVPLLSVAFGHDYSMQTRLLVSVGLSVLALFILGVTKAYVMSKSSLLSMLRSGSTVALLGSVAAGTGWIVGVLADKYTGGKAAGIGG